MTRSAVRRSGSAARASAERVATDVRDLQSFVVNFRDNRDPYAASPARVGGGDGVFGDRDGRAWR